MKILKKIIYKLLPKRIKQILNDKIFYTYITLSPDERKEKFKDLNPLQYKLLTEYCYIILKIQILFDIDYK